MNSIEAIRALREQMLSKVIGQDILVNKIIIAFLARGDILIEGLPGLAKTRAVKTLSTIIDGKFSRIQFTPDITSREIIGEERLYHQDGSEIYKFHKGAIFGNIVLADEINRAPAKSQASMLEAMDEKQVTISGQTFPLPKLFMLLATQNPIEHTGTFPLSQAQKDRFLLHTVVDYVSMAEELKMLKLLQQESIEDLDDIVKIPQEYILKAQDEVAKVKIPDEIGKYIVELVFASRYPLRYSKQLSVMIDVGISPRGTIALSRASQAVAWLDGRDSISVEDIVYIIKDVFRHRIVESQHTKENGIKIDEITEIILENVKKPL